MKPSRGLACVRQTEEKDSEEKIDEGRRTFEMYRSPQRKTRSGVESMRLIGGKASSTERKATAVNT